MPTKDGFNPDHPLFLADEPEQQGIGKAWDRVAVISSRVLKASILVATATAIGIAILSVGNPVTLFADVTASLVDKSALQPGTDQSTPTIQSTADAQALPPTAKNAPTRDEIAAASEPAGQSQTENSEPASEGLFRQFQAWAAEKDAQVGPVQSVQDAPAQVLPNAPPQVALIVEIQTPGLIGIREWLIFGPIVLMGIELQDLPTAPVRDPHVVVLISHDTVWNAVGAGHRNDRGFFRGHLELGDGPAEDPSDVEITLRVHRK